MQEQDGWNVVSTTPAPKQVAAPTADGWNVVSAAKSPASTLPPNQLGPYKPEYDTPEGFFKSAYDQTPLPAIASAIRHPIDTIAGIPAAIKSSVGDTVDQLKQGYAAHKAGNQAEADTHYISAIPLLGSVLNKGADQYAAGNYKGEAGTLLGFGASMAAPDLLPRGASALAGKLLPAVGDALETAGGGVIDRAAGTLKNDFKHGAQPGLAYLKGGGTPAISMGSLAEKAGNVADTAGKTLGSLYDSSNAVIPTSDVASTLDAPIRKLRLLQGGVGGTGVSPALDAYESQMQPALAAASARGGFTPRQLFDEIKRPIAQNTNWKDPTMFDMNTVRQQNVGGVGGLLTGAVPEAAAQNEIYQGAKNLAGRATLRANTGTPAFSSIVNRGLEGGLGAGLFAATHNPLLATLPLALDSVPAKTLAGYGMFKSGGLLKGASRLPQIPAGAMVPSYALIGKPAKGKSDGK